MTNDPIYRAALAQLLAEKRAQFLVTLSSLDAAFLRSLGIRPW